MQVVTCVFLVVNHETSTSDILLDCKSTFSASKIYKDHIWMGQLMEHLHWLCACSQQKKHSSLSTIEHIKT
jgi:hypothetical protein